MSSGAQQYPADSGPLAGVRVLDFTTTFSGPYCTQQLADLGADVIKVEAPGGDVTRGLGVSRQRGLASVYVGTNRNKASLELNLNSAEDRTLMHQLLAKADCLVHNMRLGAAKRVEIDPDAALLRNPRLVHCAITGYGSGGPYSGRPAYDDTIQAVSGLAWMQGLLSGEPQYIATAIADKVAGLSAAHAITAALFWRSKTGRGQAIEVPMFETITSFTLMEQWGGMAFEPPLGPTGYARLRSPHRKPFRTKDGYISVVVYHGGHWKRFLESMGRSELLEDERYSTTEARSQNINDLYGLLRELMTTRTTTEWLELLAKIDVPAEPIRSMDDVFDDPHLKATEFFKVVQEGEERYLTARHATKYSASPVAYPSDVPGPTQLGSGREAATRWLSESPRC